jgi:hypothetical protein
MYGLSNDTYIISSNFNKLNSSKWTSNNIPITIFRIDNGGLGYKIGQLVIDNNSGGSGLVVGEIESIGGSGNILNIKSYEKVVNPSFTTPRLLNINNIGSGAVFNYDIFPDELYPRYADIENFSLNNGGINYVNGQNIYLEYYNNGYYFKQNIGTITSINSSGTITSINIVNDIVYNVPTDNFNIRVDPYINQGAVIYGTIGEKEIIYNNNNVGIGKTNPVYRLDVANESTYSPSSTYRYFNYSTALTQVTTAGNIGNTCAKFGSDIWVEGTIAASSDTRIKNNVNDINDDSALQKILSISPKTYNYIDFINRGSNLVYGFLAQQIKEVIPEAVSIETQFIPNIYSLCEVDGSNLLLNSNIYTSNLKVSDKLLIYIDEKSLEISIKEISSNKIEIDTEINDSNVFVYGTKINDFHTLNKSYIYTLNVCATQELYKIMQEQQNTITNLLAKINEIETKINS